MNKILVIFLILFLGCKKENPKEIFTVPNNVNNFIVIYRQKKNIDYNKQNIEYKIPKNGILFVDFQRKKGILNQIVKFEDGTKLSDYAMDKFRNNIEKSEIYILDRIDGKIAFQNNNQSNIDSIYLSTENKNSTKWIGFILGKPNSNENELRRKIFKKVDSIFTKK
ncbi:hypothetical protein MTP09_06290 [Chryseobacterium suipulveris]|uniref:Lipoprotein n=1 Tax=Chryseobacterium suipulveris TaxID=2929800 RepID=A0ABY4BSR9_9FLAO|nr:hypothetical protein [Chryseobacterium suipulveris]UOE42146.1 hypothetical protein MTP09_05785 [Chryseobacterium suipulveris]UOE42245.1 hypothetical protein MTP09_06290 [Chryseobacterium suipulveris]